MSSAQQQPPGPPYPLKGALLGGVPTTAIDVPVSACLLALFAVSAGIQLTIFLRNRRVHHRPFFPSILCFGLSMVRIITMALRIAWAIHPFNPRLAIAANVFAQAGVVLLYVVNLILAHRTAVALLAPSYPRIVRPAAFLLQFCIFQVVAMIIALIVAIVYMLYTLDPTIRAHCRTVQLVASPWLATLAFLPIPVVLLSLATPRPAGTRRCGSGSMRTRIALLLGAATALALAAAYKTAGLYTALVPAPESWQVSRAPYYVFNAAIELCILLVYAAARFDRRFFVGNWRTAEMPADAESRDVRAGRDGERTEKINEGEVQ